MTSNSAPAGALFLLFLYLLHPRIFVRLDHILEQYRAAPTTDQVTQAISKHAMLFEGHQCIAVLPAQTDIRAAAVLALLYRTLFFHSHFLRFCVFANTQ